MSTATKGAEKAAILSDDGTYRYSLIRVWDAPKPRAVFIMLNPSTADHLVDDRTIGRCLGFAEAWGCGSIEVVNLFAFRSTDPAALYLAPDPMGPDNAGHILAAVTGWNVRHVVAAWGTHGQLMDMDRTVMNAMPCQVSIECLGVTVHGHPMHPLYLPASTPLRPFHHRDHV